MKLNQIRVLFLLLIQGISSLGAFAHDNTIAVVVNLDKKPVSFQA